MGKKKNAAHHKKGFKRQNSRFTLAFSRLTFEFPMKHQSRDSYQIIYIYF